MRYSIHSILPAVMLLLVGVLYVGCSEAPTSPLSGDVGIQAQDATDAGDLSAASKQSTPAAEWHIGTSWTCSLPEPGLCPLVAQAANGHTIEILQDDGAGAKFNGGTLSVHPKSVSGSGTFVHKDADGVEVASGTWTATELLSFKDWGPSALFCAPGFPLPDLCFVHAGRAHIRVHLVADSGAEFDGILRVTCIVPEAKFPASYAEGIRLNVQGGLNFNKELSGGTAFIE